MTFLGDFQLLQDMQETASADVMANWRTPSIWDARDSEYIEDPENDPCSAIHEFSNKLEEDFDSLLGKAFEAEEKAEQRWWNQLSYQEFLRSDYWNTVRHAVLSRDSNRCQTCGSTQDLQVHHRWYPKRGTELDHLGALVTLCSRCHSGEHH